MITKIKKWEHTVGNIEKRYWINLNVRSDMKVSTYLWKIWFPSLKKLLNNK
jgi:hypothetical protein